MKNYIFCFIILLSFNLKGQECEKIVVNKVNYDCFYDGSWDITQGNLAMIEFIKSRSTGDSHIEYTTKDYLDQKFYNFSENYNIDWKILSKTFTLASFKLYINNVKFKSPYNYEQIFELGNFNTITSLSHKRKKIYIKTK